MYAMTTDVLYSESHPQRQHTGPVYALDINPGQPNLMASASSASEVFVWDLNNPTQHLTPGPKTMVSLFLFLSISLSSPSLLLSLSFPFFFSLFLSIALAVVVMFLILAHVPISQSRI